MIRISKGYDERRKEIIETSLQLFWQHGYDNTPISMILDKIGISKGAFYYYFKSKRDLLDAIVEERTQQIMQTIMPIIQSDKLSAIEKLNTFFQKALQEKAEMKDFLQTLYQVWMKEENLIMKHNMEKKNMSRIAPQLSKVIEQGILEKSFKLEKATGVAEMILKLGTVVNDVILELYEKYQMDPPAEEVVYITELYQLAIERILAAPKCSIRIFDKKALLKAVK